jgi:hypothetical protein
MTASATAMDLCLFTDIETSPQRHQRPNHTVLMCRWVETDLDRNQD